MIQTVLHGAYAVLGFVGALSLLLFGMDMLSNGIQKGAGGSLQKLLGKITGNRWSALLTGVAVTAIIQSSGATTVMVVSFVNAEIISLTQAIGIIFGANIGTTVTAWIVSLFGFSFSISAAAVPLFGIGFVLGYFKKYRIHNFAGCFMGFAMLFLGLGLLKDTLSLRPESVAFLQNFSRLGAAGLVAGVFIGIAVTALIHSSSAMTAIVLTMAANGSLSWELSAAIILGSNIGSTVDAVLSAIGASVNARRTAFVHVMFNVVGTAVALCVFRPFLALVDILVSGTPQDNITNHIAMLHTVFNVLAALLFIPFVNQIAAFATRVIKDSPKKADVGQYVFPAILPFSHVSADACVLQVQREIARMAEKIMDMFDSIADVFMDAGGGEAVSVSERVNASEQYVDEMNGAITDFLQNCSRIPSANSRDREQFMRMIQVTDALESLSDECCSLMHTLLKYMGMSDGSGSSSPRMREISGYLEKVRLFYEQVCQFVSLGISDNEKLMSRNSENEIDAVKKVLKRDSRRRIEEGGDVKKELRYMDVVRKIEKAGDCVYAVVRVI